MPTFTRVLLAGFYVAVLALILIVLMTDIHSRQLFEPARLLSSMNRFSFTVAASLILCLLALTFDHQRVLLLAAAGANAFYALGGFVLLIWPLMRGRIGTIDPEDPLLFLFLVFVPAVAATAFFSHYQAIGVAAPNHRLERP